ncbi:hypothetical protein D1109_00985 [Actinobacillus pleuropneumoniae]|nr:hypothetical protein D1109_00050 [Actinobacillus pleuropneumoniae]UKH21704.1 hypothetical protein D1109_00985 [Actinobacillus pleuropneumoniae]
MSWGEIVEQLIASGHIFSEICHYTARQTELFYTKALKRERNLRASRTMDVAFGVNGGKEIKDYLEQLTAL